MPTRDTLLDHAEHAARRAGLNGFSFADLARHVGIRKASVHHHFPTKADLALSLIERYAERFTVQLSAITQRENTAGAQLLAYISAYRQACNGGQTVCLCVAFSAGPDALSAAVLDRLDRFHTESLAWLDAVFTRGGEDASIFDVARPSAEAAACLATLEGAQLMARASGDIKRFDAAASRLIARTF